VLPREARKARFAREGELDGMNVFQSNAMEVERVYKTGDSILTEARGEGGRLMKEFFWLGRARKGTGRLGIFTFLPVLLSPK